MGQWGWAQLELTDALLSHRGNRRAHSTHYTLGSDKFCRQNFEQNKRLLRAAFCRQNKAFSSRI